MGWMLSPSNRSGGLAQVKLSATNIPSFIAATSPGMSSGLFFVKELEIDSRHHNSRNFFQRVKNWRKGFQPRTNIISDEKGQLMADSGRVVARWGQYFRGLLNMEHPSADSTPPTLPHDMTIVPTISREELRRNLKSLKNNRAPGSDNNPGEL